MRDDRRVPSCQGKRLYTDHATAVLMAKRTNRDRDARVQEYHCCLCHGWHVGEARRTGARPRQEFADETGVHDNDA